MIFKNSFHFNFDIFDEWKRTNNYFLIIFY